MHPVGPRRPMRRPSRWIPSTKRTTTEKTTTTWRQRGVIYRLYSPTLAVRNRHRRRRRRRLPPLPLPPPPLLLLPLLLLLIVARRAKARRLPKPALPVLRLPPSLSAHPSSPSAAAPLPPEVPMKIPLILLVNRRRLARNGREAPKRPRARRPHRKVSYLFSMYS